MRTLGQELDDFGQDLEGDLARGSTYGGRRIEGPQGGTPPPPNFGQAFEERQSPKRKEPQDKNTVPHLSSCVTKCGRPDRRRQEGIPTQGGLQVIKIQAKICPRLSKISPGA